MALTVADTLQIITYDLDAINPGRGGSYPIVITPSVVAGSKQFGGYLLSDYKIGGSKPAHTVIRAAGTQYSISALDDIEERELTATLTFEATTPGLSHTQQATEIKKNISAWTKLLLNNGDAARLIFGGFSDIQFVGRLTDVGDIEPIIYDHTLVQISYTFKGYLSAGLCFGYHTAYTQATIEGTATHMPALLDFKKTASTSGVWVCGTRITGLTDYTLIRFDGIRKKLLAAKAPASGELPTWENVMQTTEGFNGFPYVNGGEKYKLAELPAVGTASNGSSTTSGVSAAYSAYDAILI